MDNEQIEQLFEELARRYRPIHHTKKAPRFARFNIDEVVTGLRADLDLSEYCLLLEAPTGGLEDNQGDQVFDNLEVAYMVVRQCELYDFDAERRILNDSKKMGFQLLTKLVQELDQYPQLVPIDLNTVEYEKAGPVFTHCFGYRISFTLSQAIALQVDTEQWDE